MNLTRLNQIACLNTLNSIRLENHREAMNEFLLMNRINRSLSISARPLILKLSCYLSIMQSMDTVNYLVNFGDLSDNEVTVICKSFGRLSEQHVSFKNCIIFEYIAIANISRDILPESNYRNPAFKYNSAQRFRCSYCKNLVLRDEGKQYNTICELSVWPWETPNWPKMHLYGDAAEKQFQRHSLYFYYNPVGCLALTLSTSDMFSDRRFQQKESVLIKDDLFQWVLARRLGQEGSLKARAYSDQYTVDIEKGLVFSVGPDGQAYTEDDIKLPIDPAVLGLK